MRIALIVPLACAALLPACDSQQDSPPPPAATPSSAAATVPPMVSPVTPSDTATIPPAGFEKMDIPAAIQGRWGMVAADCERGRADAKGLLEISARRLKFYESVGTLDELDEMEPTRIRGEFRFTGEGMTWDRDVILDVQDGGKTLIRREYGDNAAPGPFRYTKCA